MQIFQFHRHGAVLLATIALAGCSSGSHNYPSLAIRDAERVSGTFSVAPDANDPIAPAPAPANVIESLLQQLALASAAHDNFMQLSGEAERLAVAAIDSDPDSNDWAAAQVALAQLESQRSQAAISLGSLDLLYADASLGFTERQQIDAVRDQVLDLVRQEDEVLAQLSSSITD